jgi:putative glycosyltransferase (TIGR04372 family)
LILSIFWALPIIFSISLIRSWILIRFCSLTSGRLGDSVTDFVEQDIQRRYAADKSLRVITFYYFETRVHPNAYWKSYMERNFRISGEWARQVDFWITKLNVNSIHHHKPTETCNRDVNGTIHRYQYKLDFSQKETTAGEQWLRRHGWKTGQKIICIHIRDRAFLENSNINRPDKDSNLWNYHNFRNSDIASYKLSILWLLKNDFFVIRMGSIAENRVEVFDKSFVDLPFLSDKKPFLDIWLMSKAFASIGTYSGLDHVAIVNRVPVLFLNALPLAEIFSYARMMWVPKTLTWCSNSKPLTIREHLCLAWFNRSESYIDSGIKIDDLTENRIFEYVQEFIFWLQTDYKISEVDEILIEKFWNIFKSWEAYEMMHNWIHPHALPALSWLRRQPEFN